MGSIVISNLYVLTLFISIAVDLTLAVNNDVKTDGRDSSTSIANVSSRNDHGSLSSLDQPLVEFGELRGKHERNDSSPLHASEGGPIIILSTTQPIASGLAAISNKKRIEGGGYEQMENNPMEEERDDTPSKIVPRKGADQASFDSRRTSLNKTVSINSKSTVESSDLKNSTHINERHGVNESRVKSDVTVKHLGDTWNSSANANAQITNVSEQAMANATLIVSSTKKHKPKPKPTVTIGGRENDPNKPIPASPTKNPPLGMPRKIDYIVPVVITIVALPLLGAATYIVYRQGRDCWDKRHYRRMDFLIDGMYND